MRNQTVTDKLNNIFKKILSKIDACIMYSVYIIYKVTKVTIVTIYYSILVKALLNTSSICYNLESICVEILSHIYTQKFGYFGFFGYFSQCIVFLLGYPHNTGDLMGGIHGIC